MREIRGIAVLFALLSVIASSPMAQPAEPLDPAGAVRIALDHHPALQAAQFEVLAAEAEHDLARSGYLPRVDVVEELNHSTNPVFVFASKLGQERFGPADFAIDSLNRPDALTNSATRVTLRQSVWDAGRTRLGALAAEIGVDATRLTRRRTEEQIAFRAVGAFWDRVVAEEMLQVIRQAETAAVANRDIAAAQVEAGLRVPSDRMSAELRLGEVRALRIRAEQGLEVARAALHLALGVADDREFRPVLPLQPEREGDSLEARQLRAAESRADLLALERRIRQSQVGRRIARSGRLPELGLGAQYEWNGETLLATDGSNWTVGLSVRVPVFDGFETRARVARAEAQSARLEAIDRELRQRVRLEVRAAWAERESAAQRLDVARASLELAGETLRIVRDRYAEGLAVMVELLAAETAETRARADLVSARGDLWLAEAGLDLATGVGAVASSGEHR